MYVPFLMQGSKWSVSGGGHLRVPNLKMAVISRKFKMQQKIETIFTR